MRVKSIIREELLKFMKNNSIREASEDNKYTKQQEKAKMRDGRNVSSGDEAQIRHDVNNADLINIAALAREVYPDHTPEGSQSQLLKKLKVLKNDNGSEYHIKQREAGAIRKALNDI